MKIFFILISLCVQLTFAQSDVINNLYHDYQKFREKSFTNKEVKHDEITPLIESLKDNDIFELQCVGTSLLNREIYRIKLGKGEKKIFLWSQMHGDEHTATKAIFDILNFFKSSDENYKSFKEELLNQLSIFIIPMTNPDGAAINNRRNLFEIDLNRDALNPQSPESKILMSSFQEIEPLFSFNLHDQYSNYSVGKTNKTAAISFLAPSTGEKTENPSQIRSKQLIVNLAKSLNRFIPGHIAKYSDEYEPRAFGDNFQKLGGGVILIESGGWKADDKKNFIRKLNFLTLIDAMSSIAKNTYTYAQLEEYDQIPFNQRRHFDLILRNVKIEKNGNTIMVDIGINKSESRQQSTIIEDIGDLSNYFGVTEFDFSGYMAERGKSKELTKEMGPVELFDLLKNGYTSVILKNDVKLRNNLPQNIITRQPTSNFEYYKKSAELIIRKANSIEYIIVKNKIYNFRTNLVMDF
ncbi:MAG TPA: M14 family zinc carboxypeptidase [Ignavibacteriaceae bacterium]|nr:M14 family zinc carboxypeptidase [Ignavibacteriaceae bacterium]